jgi:hypothetical protein
MELDEVRLPDLGSCSITAKANTDSTDTETGQDQAKPSE